MAASAKRLPSQAALIILNIPVVSEMGSSLPHSVFLRPSNPPSIPSSPVHPARPDVDASEDSPESQCPSLLLSYSIIIIISYQYPFPIHFPRIMHAFRASESGDGICLLACFYPFFVLSVCFFRSWSRDHTIIPLPCKTQHIHPSSNIPIPSIRLAAYPR